MKTIGLCGGSGSGKGLAASYFAQHGFFHIDTDDIYHKITSFSSPCTEAVALEFGEAVLNASGGLDRRALSRIVFGNDCKRRISILNKITHKYVLSEVRKIMADCEKKAYKAVLVDAPLLFESGFDKECDAVVSVVADKSIRISRIVLRDKISEEEANARISSQIDDSFLREHSDYVIVNNGDVQQLISEVETIAKKILS